MLAIPASALISVDLPAPEEPRKAAVAPGSMAARIASRPSPASALTASTGTPGARRSTSRCIDAASSQRSALLRTITGRAPPA